MEPAVGDPAQQEASGRDLARRVGDGGQLAAREAGHVAQRLQERTAAGVGAGLAEGLGEQLRRQPAEEGEVVRGEPGVHGVDPGVEGAHRGDGGGVLAQVERRRLLEVGAVHGRGAARIGDEGLVVGRRAQYDGRVEVLLAQVLEDRRGVVLRLLLEEEDLDPVVLHGHDLLGEVGLARRKGGVVEHVVTQVLHGGLLLAPGRLGRRQVGDDRGGVLDLAGERRLEVLERPERPALAGRVPPKLSSRLTPPTRANACPSAAVVSCLLVAPWNASSVDWTTSLRPLTPPWAFT